MAQARRASRTGRQDREAVLLQGSYSFEQKVTVEWERHLELGAFDELLSSILTEPRSFAEIRAYVSGALMGDLIGRDRRSWCDPLPGEAHTLGLARECSREG